jgi:hypothetical protein
MTPGSLGYPSRKSGADSMVKTIARGVFLFALALMIASWAMTVGNSKPVEPQQELPTDRMYS